MKRIGLRFLGILLPLCLIQVIGVTPSRADTVRIQHGANEFGQGWMFLDTDGACKVVTAGHVVTTDGGKLLKDISVVDGRGRVFSIGQPEVLPTKLNDVEIDIAVLPLPAAGSASECPGRLVAEGIARRMNGGRALRLERTESTQRDVINVQLSSTLIEASGGALFSVHPVRASDQIQKGWSGSVVLDDDGPVGIVFDTFANDNEAGAVRVDAIRQLMARAALQRRNTGNQSAVTALALVYGHADAAGLGPSSVLGSGDGDWKITADRKAIVIVMKLPDLTKVQGVVLETGNANDLTSLGVGRSASEAGEDWIDAASCAPQGMSVIECRLLPATVRRLRIVLRTRTDAPIDLRALRYE